MPAMQIIKTKSADKESMCNVSAPKNGLVIRIISISESPDNTLMAGMEAAIATKAVAEVATHIFHRSGAKNRVATNRVSAKSSEI